MPARAGSSDRAGPSDPGNKPRPLLLSGDTTRHGHPRETFNVAWLLAGVAAWLTINIALVYLRTRRARGAEENEPRI